MANGWYGDGRKKLFVRCDEGERIGVTMMKDDKPLGTVYLLPEDVRSFVGQMVAWQVARLPATIDGFGQALRDYGEACKAAMEEAEGGASGAALTDAQSLPEGGSAARSDCLRGLSCTG